MTQNDFCKGKTIKGIYLFPNSNGVYGHIDFTDGTGIEMLDYVMGYKDNGDKTVTELEHLIAFGD
jgi:hypothetical protein